MDNRVREVLIFQGRSQRWLADHLGVSESYLSKVLDGERDLPAEWPARIGQMLAVPPRLLFLDSISSTPNKVTRRLEGAAS